MAKQGMRPNGKGAFGFTLIEMMMAMTITSVGLFSIIQSQYVVMRGHAMARERMEATMIAQGAMQEIRTRALRWSAMPGTAASTTFLSIFPELALTASPGAGENLPFSALRPLPRYVGQPICLTGSTAINGAFKINTRGESVTNTPLALRALYRVHYLAFLLPINPTVPTVLRADLVRIVLFVSWDNKDHGEQSYDWAGEWYNEDHFFKRQMVQMTFNLTQNKLW